MEETAALLASSGAFSCLSHTDAHPHVSVPVCLFCAHMIACSCAQRLFIVSKQRFAGVSKLSDQLRAQGATPATAAALLTHVLPCLRDHNSKIALGALEILERLLLAPVAESTLRSTFKLLWTSVVERLGDSKLHVRQKAGDVVVAVSVVLDVSIVLEKLQLCMKHKNWRTREQVQTCWSG